MRIDVLGRIKHLARTAIFIAAGWIQIMPASAVVGAIPGQFAVSETGAATYSIPISVPPGAAGMEPKLALTYNSQGGNGLLGVGWSLSGLSAITRCPRTIVQDGANGGVEYSSNDKYCLDGQRLVAVTGSYGANGTEYRTELESFAKVVSYGTAGNGPAWFKVWTKSGQIMEYGNTMNSRIEAQGKATVAVWAVNKISDTKGNYLTVTYIKDNANGQYYPSRIDYTGNANTGLATYNRIDFTYAGRAVNTPAVYIGGSKSQTTQRLTTLTTWAGSTQSRTYTLGYAPQGDFLGSIQECDRAGTNNCLNPTGFTWNFPSGSGDFESTTGIRLTGADLNQIWFASSGDVNGDGYDDLLSVVTGGDNQSHLMLRLATGNAATPFNAPVDVGTTPLRDCSIPANCTENQVWQLPAAARVSILGDVDRDGRADLILADGRVALGQANSSFGIPYAANVQIGAARFADAKDVNGDGRADLMFGVAGTDGLTHYYLQYAQADGAYANPAQIATTPLARTIDVTSGLPSAPNQACAATLGDVNGDGRADLITCQGLVYLAMDGGFAAGSSWGNFDTSRYSGLMARFLSAGDLNGDGFSDIFSAPGAWNGLTWGIYDTSKPDGQSLGPATYQWQNIVVTPALGDTSTPSLGPWFGFLAGNFTGRGHTDAVEFSAGIGVIRTYLMRALVTPPAQITGITDGLGSSNTITYSTLNNSAVYTASTGSMYPQRDLPPTASALNVVSSTSADNGVSGSFVFDYQYAGGRADVLGRGFLGFQTVTTTNQQTNLVSRTEYRQDHPYTGLPSLSEKSLNGVVLNRSTPTYGLKTFGSGASLRYFPYAQQSVEESYELSGSLVSRTTTSQTYDDWGNPTQIVVGSNDGYSKTTVNTYDNDITNWILGRLRRATVTSTTPTP
ncbi:MAG: hypothetical protein B7Y41_09900 [Hydrogenophilales bacterium 28-61-23]|nr:MAG: hypothetical protein B7Y41_09900 [Hydrogenophilales bacterium 28-61-23]